MFSVIVGVLGGIALFQYYSISVVILMFEIFSTVVMGVMMTISTKDTSNPMSMSDFSFVAAVGLGAGNLLGFLSCHFISYCASKV